MLGYLTFVGLFMVSGKTWANIFSGFVKFGQLPDTEIDWATLAAFAAIAGAGGLSNMNFSNYTREKGWGMGSLVGAIPSMVGGKTIRLSHVGKVFPLSEGNLKRWKGWILHIVRDQVAIWSVGCVLGMALPSLLSLEFIPGAEVEGHAAAAMTARGIADRSGEIYWYLTLLCGFIVLAPGQMSDIDGVVRRWTDVIWTGSTRARKLEGHQVRNIYYTILLGYVIWGLIALRLTPNPLVLAIFTGTLRNIGLGLPSSPPPSLPLALCQPQLTPPRTTPALVSTSRPSSRVHLLHGNHHHRLPPALDTANERLEKSWRTLWSEQSGNRHIPARLDEHFAVDRDLADFDRPSNTDSWLLGPPGPPFPRFTAEGLVGAWDGLVGEDGVLSGCGVISGLSTVRARAVLRRLRGNWVNAPLRARLRV